MSTLIVLARRSLGVLANPCVGFHLYGQVPVITYVVTSSQVASCPGVVGNEPIGALAHLGLVRAYALSGDTANAQAAYQDFLALWKDADPDIPILKEAKAEYAKLQ
ncbi:MAG: hypothetical protein WA735_15560 [Candidatus Acidiferrales bacterium]